MMAEQKLTFEHIVAQERGRLLNFIRRRVKDREEAEDILQDVMQQAIVNLNSLQAIDKMVGWLYSITRNKIVDWYRKNKKNTVSMDDDLSESLKFSDLFAEVPEEDAVVDKTVLIAALVKAIEELPEDQKYVIVEQTFEGRTFQEMAEDMGVSINTLLARKRYAVLSLRKKLDYLFHQD